MDEFRQCWTALRRWTEIPVLRLKRANPEGARPSQSWGIGVEGAPSVVMIRDTDEGLDVSIDWLTLSARALETVDDPATYVAGTVGMGMSVGALLGRSGTAAAAGAVLGGLVGLLAQTQRSHKPGFQN